jgi:sRNA-binding carbon storage regulator CsrA
MLVLSRFDQEKICIGSEIVLTVVRCDLEFAVIEILLPEDATVTYSHSPDPFPRSRGGAVRIVLEPGDYCLINVDEEKSIEVHIVDLRRQSDSQRCKARMGFEAPSEIPIHRKEVYDAIHLENQGKQDNA